MCHPLSMIYTPLTVKAARIAYDAHHEQYDVCGMPYIFHPFTVAENMTDEYSTCVALLHDVVEDTDVTLDDLAGEFPEEVIEAVRLMTHDKDVDYEEYVTALKGNPIARAVKLADVAHNSNCRPQLQRVPQRASRCVREEEGALAQEVRQGQGDP